MARSVTEWVGKTDDTDIPPRVRLRVLAKYGFECQCGCLRVILPHDRWQCDHVVALINGGENRESNLAPLLEACHKVKTARDAAVKAKTYRMATKYRGIKRRKGRGLSHPYLRKKINGEVVPR